MSFALLDFNTVYIYTRHAASNEKLNSVQSLYGGGREKKFVSHRTVRVDGGKELWFYKNGFYEILFAAALHSSRQTFIEF